MDVNSVFFWLFSNQIVAIATAALDVFKVEAKKMVVALVDMERAFVPPQHFIRLVQRRYAFNTLLCIGFFNFFEQHLTLPFGFVT